MSAAKFPTGNVCVTRGVFELLRDPPALHAMLSSLDRHVRGDWGDVCEEDKQANDAALVTRDRLVSAYMVAGERVWIITEADRWQTTVLLPEEY